MRGSAVPTIVWSSAARKSASPTPTVAKILLFRVISTDTGCLLWVCIDARNRLTDVAERCADPLALRLGQAGEDVGDGDRRRMLEALQVPATLGRQRHAHGAAVGGVGLAPHEGVVL